jgi:flagellar motor switch protein FliM
VKFLPGQFVDDVYGVPGFSADTETVAAVFSLKLGAADGEFAVILPFAFLKPLMPELDMAKLLNSGQETGKAAAGDKALLGIAVNLKVFLGRLEIKVKDLNSLAPGDVLRLDTRPDDEVTVEVEGQPRFAARTGKIGAGLGVQIIRMIEPEKQKEGDKNANSK